MADSHTTEKQKILIVDDSPFNRALLIDILGEEYDCLEAESGLRALEVIRETPSVALVLLDMVMPEMDGFAVLEQMQQYRWIDEIPVIVISAEQTDSFMERAYDLGATDYLGRPFHALVVRRRVQNTLALYAKQRWLTHLFTEQTLEKEKLSSLLLGVFGSVVESHNGENGQHILRVRTITEALLRQVTKETRRYQLSELDIVRIGMASALHDIGKNRIPEELLTKPAALTPEEFAVIKEHTVIGAEMISSMTDWQEEPLLATAYEICRWHHERWDGRGYPDGLRGESIPISAQAVSLADAYAALTAQRSYKPAFDQDTAIRMIMEGKCGAFNPLLLECLHKIRGQIAAEVDLPAGGRDDLMDSKRISAELLQQEGFLGQNLPQRMLDYMTEKRDFYAAQCGGIQFEYVVMDDQVHLTNYLESPAQRTISCSSQELEKLSILRPEDLQRLEEIVLQTTPEAPECSMEVPLTLGLETHLFRLTAHVVWSHEEPRQRLMVVGQLRDLSASAPMNLSIRTDPASAQAGGELRGLERLFDVVRLVDPKSMTACRLDDTGRLTEDGTGCQTAWGLDGHGKDELAEAAYVRKSRLSKLKFSDTDTFHITAQCVDVNGEPRVLELISKVDDGRWVDNNGKRLLLSSENIDDDLICRDPLTGVYSRYYLEHAFYRAGEIDGVVMMDVDHFKSINDTYGHPTGDLALRAISGAISACARETDTVIRYGGDEFLLLLGNLKEEELPLRIQEVQDAVSTAVVKGYPELKLSVSAGGVYGVPSLGDAIRRADQRMYRNKAARDNESKSKSGTGKSCPAYSAC